MTKLIRFILIVAVFIVVALLAARGSVLAAATNWCVDVPAGSGVTCTGSFDTITEALANPDFVAGDTIVVGPGSHSGAYLDTQVNIRGLNGAVIDSGPAHPSGMVMGFRLRDGSSGSSIRGLRFTVDLAIISGAKLDHVTVTRNTFVNSVQAVTAWRGSYWTITYNTIIDLRTNNGGGIGILVGDYTGGTVTGNVVSNNTISGTVHVSPVDGGGYNASGIVTYADYRWGRAGAAAITGNTFAKNRVSLVSDTPAVVDVAAFELTEARDIAAPEVITGNQITYNDFRGTTLQVVLTPETLLTLNTFHKNLGMNRGHGQDSSIFE